MIIFLWFIAGFMAYCTIGLYFGAFFTAGRFYLNCKDSEKQYCKEFSKFILVWPFMSKEKVYKWVVKED